eukprot:826588_1
MAGSIKVAFQLSPLLYCISIISLWLIVFPSKYPTLNVKGNQQQLITMIQKVDCNDTNNTQIIEHKVTMEKFINYNIDNQKYMKRNKHLFQKLNINIDQLYFIRKL